jgi:hypothetical protein
VRKQIHPNAPSILPRNIVGDVLARPGKGTIAHVDEDPLCSTVLPPPHRITGIEELGTILGGILTIQLTLAVPKGSWFFVRVSIKPPTIEADVHPAI